MKTRLFNSDATMAKQAGTTNIIETIRNVPPPAGVVEYGFQNKKIAHSMIQPTEATKPMKEAYLDFIEKTSN